MSIYALNLAFKADIPKSSTKFVLVAMADYANEDMEIYPTIETLVAKTSLNKKTIMLAIADLISCGLLIDTGNKKGTTCQTKVYKLVIERVPILEQYQKRNSTNFSTKEYQNRDALRVPKTVHRTINLITPIEPPLSPYITPPKKIAEPSHAFEQFWNAYPRKQDKARAVSSWKKQKLDNRLDEILMAVGIWSKAKQWQNPLYIPHAATWLNNKRFTKEALQDAMQTTVKSMDAFELAIRRVDADRKRAENSDPFAFLDHKKD